MNKTTLIILICSVVLVLLTFIIIVRISNRKRFKRLQENLKKIKAENEQFDHDKRISLPNEENSNQPIALDSSNVQTLDKIKSTNGKKPIVEDYNPSQEEVGMPLENLEEGLGEEEINNQFENDFAPDFSRSFQPRSFERQKEDDFEKFMNEHSYSRRVVDPPLVEKIKKLPPEIRMLLLSNIFDKFDDDKK